MKLEKWKRWEVSGLSLLIESAGQGGLSRSFLEVFGAFPGGTRGVFVGREGCICFGALHDTQVLRFTNIPPRLESLALFLLSNVE